MNTCSNGDKDVVKIFKKWNFTAKNRHYNCGQFCHKNPNETFLVIFKQCAEPEQSHFSKSYRKY